MNEYTILEELGKDGFSTVYKVRHNESGSLHAIRVLNQPVAGEQSKAYQNFLCECKPLLRIGNGSHRNIVHIYKPGLVDGRAMVEMDYVDGTDLTHYLKENDNFIPADEVIRMVREMSAALSYCHNDLYKSCLDPDVDKVERDPDDASKWLVDKETQKRLVRKYKVIHNDINSGNIIRRRDGSYVLMDFGLAMDGEEAVRAGSRRENIRSEYASPEKLKDESVLSEQSDVYSFGVVMYEYLAGRLPYAPGGGITGSLPSIAGIRGACFESKFKGIKYVKDYPDWLEEAIVKCLDIDPSKRFRNGRQLKKFIKEHLKADAHAGGNVTPRVSIPDNIAAPKVDSPAGGTESRPFVSPALKTPPVVNRNSNKKLIWIPAAAILAILLIALGVVRSGHSSSKYSSSYSSGSYSSSSNYGSSGNSYNSSSYEDDSSQYRSSVFRGSHSFVGKVGGRYSLHSFLNFDNLTGYEYYDSQGPNATISLSIEYWNEGSEYATFRINEYYDGRLCGYFDVSLSDAGYMEGTFTNAIKGNSMSFYANMVD